MLDLEIRQAMERYQDRLREAEQNRQYQLALQANGHRGYLRKRAAARLGIWLIVVGRRLEAQNGHDGLHDGHPAPATPLLPPYALLSNLSRRGVI